VEVIYLKLVCGLYSTFVSFHFSFLETLVFEFHIQNFHGNLKYIPQHLYIILLSFCGGSVAESLADFHEFRGGKGGMT
jgi:hypothetical protein